MDEILAILAEINLPFAYNHFTEGESPSPPFICYLLPSSENFSADGKTYYKINEVNLELDTDKKTAQKKLPWNPFWITTVFFTTKPRYGLTAKSCTRSYTNFQWRINHGRQQGKI